MATREPNTHGAVAVPMPPSVREGRSALSPRQLQVLGGVAVVVALLLAYVMWPRRRWQDHRAEFPNSPPAARLALRDPLLHPELVVSVGFAGAPGAWSSKWVTVDSGATGVLLPESFYDALGLEQLRGVTVRTEDLRGAVFVRPAGVVPTVELGPLNVTNVVVAVGGAAPVVGQTVLAHSSWSVDWDAGSLTFGAGDIPAGATVLPLRRQGDAEVVTMTVDGQPVDMVVDTGAAVSILPEVVAAQTHLENRYTPGPVVFRSVAGEFVVRKYLEGEARLGSLELGRTRFAAIATGGRRAGLGLLGLDVLSRFRIHVTPGKSLALLPRGDLRQTARARIARWGFLPPCQHEGCLVARVEPVGDDAKLELAFEADVKVPVEVLLGCRVDPDDVAVVNSLGLDFSSDHDDVHHVRVRLSEAASGQVSTVNILGGGRWFAEGGRQCQELMALDVVPTAPEPPDHRRSASPVVGPVEVRAAELQASLWW